MTVLALQPADLVFRDVQFAQARQPPCCSAAAKLASCMRVNILVLRSGLHANGVRDQHAQGRGGGNGKAGSQRQVHREPWQPQAEGRRERDPGGQAAGAQVCQQAEGSGARPQGCLPHQGTLAPHPAYAGFGSVPACIRMPTPPIWVWHVCCCHLRVTSLTRSSIPHSSWLLMRKSRAASCCHQHLPSGAAPPPPLLQQQRHQLSSHCSSSQAMKARLPGMSRHSCWQSLYGALRIIA